MKHASVSAIIGMLLGFLASKMLFLQWITLIPWGLAGLVVGYVSNSRKQSVINGGSYGFLLGFVFMMGQYTGHDPLPPKFSHLLYWVS